MNLLEDYLSTFSAPYTVFDHAAAISKYKKRDPLAHKGNFGHALLLAGSFGKIGAAILASRACLSAGAGLLTTRVPGCGYEILQATLPEAMVSVDEDQFRLTDYPADLEMFQSAGIGPGMGTQGEDTITMLKNFLETFNKPLVLDADALNIISNHPTFWSSIKPNTIITPHPKEFDRLFGNSSDNKTRLEKAKLMALRHQIVIVLKGHFTGVFLPDETISFNINGNAGMAKGGSGDVLTGIITALLSQSYPPETAARLGVYLHGAAGDLAAKSHSEEAMLATDLIHNLGTAFLNLKSASGAIQTGE